MDHKRTIQWLIPVLYGVAVGIIIAWTVEVVLPGRNAVAKYLSFFGIAALFIATLLKSQTGYNWPWEGSTDWDDARPRSASVFWRNLALWMVVVMLLLVLFTFLQPGFR